MSLFDGLFGGLGGQQETPSDQEIRRVNILLAQRMRRAQENEFKAQRSNDTYDAIREMAESMKENKPNKPDFDNMKRAEKIETKELTEE